MNKDYFRLLTCSMLVCAAAAIQAAPNPLGDSNAQELLRQQERERLLREQLDQTPDVRLPQPAVEQADSKLPVDEQPCFEIKQITLGGDGAERFQWALKAAGDHHDPAIGRCLGSQGVNLVMRRIQNAIIARGYVTTRVLAPQQDLRSGVLALTVVPGRIHAIRFADPAQESYAPGVLLTAVPARAGDVLNLRDIEQALENLKRLPTVEADIQIVPAADAGQSDLVISWKQRFPLRLSLSLDDSGSKYTGRYQGNAAVSWDNPLRLNDTLYVSASHNLFGPHDKGTRGYNVNYVIPFGYWQLALSTNSYDYHQTVPGYGKNYDYGGDSQNSDARLSRIIYRDAHRKTGLTLRGWLQESRNNIDGTNIEIQQRRTAGWESGVNHTEYLGNASLNLNLTWHQGTGALAAIPAPEEAFNEGASRPRIIMAGAQYNQPFALGSTRWRYSGEWRAQWNRTPLVPQDRFSIGNRYTVRGFNGDYTLTGDRGWLVRNDLALALGQSNQELYVGLDYGEVNGPSTEWIIGKHLAGSVVGLRGGYKGFSYDAFIGWPISQPAQMPSAGTVYGFSASLSF